MCQSNSGSESAANVALGSIITEDTAMALTRQQLQAFAKPDRLTLAQIFCILRAALKLYRCVRAAAGDVDKIVRCVETFIGEVEGCFRTRRR